MKIAALRWNGFNRSVIWLSLFQWREFVIGKLFQVFRIRPHHAIVFIGVGQLYQVNRTVFSIVEFHDDSDAASRDDSNFRVFGNHNLIHLFLFLG